MSVEERFAHIDSPILVSLSAQLRATVQGCSENISALIVKATEATETEELIPSVTWAIDVSDTQDFLLWCKDSCCSAALCVGSVLWPCNNHKQLLGHTSFSKWKQFLFSTGSKQMRLQVIYQMMLAHLETWNVLQSLRKFANFMESG